MNHFDLFNISLSFSLDLKALDKQYFALQVKYHPDKARNEEGKQEFLLKAIDINDGYRILKNDYARAVYILKLQQIDIENEAANYPLPSEVLEQIWDDREELEETKNLQLFLASKADYRTKLLNELSTAFDVANFKKAAILTLMLKYLDNLITSANQKIG